MKTKQKTKVKARAKANKPGVGKSDLKGAMSPFLDEKIE